MKNKLTLKSLYEKLESLENQLEATAESFEDRLAPIEEALDEHDSDEYDEYEEKSEDEYEEEDDKFTNCLDTIATCASNLEMIRKSIENNLSQVSIIENALINVLEEFEIAANDEEMNEEELDELDNEDEEEEEETKFKFNKRKKEWKKLTF